MTKRKTPAKRAATRKQPLTVVPPNRLHKIMALPYFNRVYVAGSLLVLLATTVFWSLLGAKLQLSNADQLVDPSLFTSSATLHAATFPGAHSFLLKWPLFWLLQLTGSTATAFTIFTVAAVLATVGLLVFILSRIERRPLVFGTLCLALASVLLLVPAQPYAGALLPINMAMLATRNLEYIVYIASLFLVIRSPKFKSWSFWLGVLCLGVVAASDKLFLYFGLGSALIGLVVYALVNNWKLANLSVRWLVGVAVAALVAVGLLGVVQASGLAHISQSTGSGPYGLDLTPKHLILGSAYGLLGLLTNFGANPAYDAVTVRVIPHQALTRLFSVSGPAFVLNGLLLIGAGYAVWRLLQASLFAKNRDKVEQPLAAKLATFLIWSTATAAIIFVATNHYYAVDARYLTIALFTAVIAVAVYSRQKSWRPDYMVVAGAVLLVGILLALPAVSDAYFDGRAALSDTNNRNSLIAQAINGHPVSRLVGDYWRVVPTRLASKNKLSVIPLSNCTQAQTVQASTADQQNWQKHSFAYLLSLDKGLTGYPGCTLKQITTAYGHPNGSVLIAGSFSSPKELLLFYDHGVHASAPKAVSSIATTVVPITLDQLNGTICNGPSVMNIVAHQDDDLLFMNPDLLHDIQAGSCVRTVYITAGDAGANKFYWLGRESGSEAAYDQMDGPSKDVWIQRTVALSAHEFVTVANPRGNPKLSLIFLHLPDGNLQGQGFKTSNYESLNKLENGPISTIASVDRQSSYSATDLTNALVQLMHTYEPSAIHTQSPRNMSAEYPDHSDHLAAGQFTQRAYKQYEQEQYANQVTIPISYYIGYPIHAMPANITDGDLQAKTAAFLAYAKYDGGVCNTVQQCQHTPTYGSYLDRQYQQSDE